MDSNSWATFFVTKPQIYWQSSLFNQIYLQWTCEVMVYVMRHICLQLDYHYGFFFRTKGRAQYCTKIEGAWFFWNILIFIEMANPSQLLDFSTWYDHNLNIWSPFHCSDVADTWKCYIHMTLQNDVVRSAKLHLVWNYNAATLQIMESYVESTSKHTWNLVTSHRLTYDQSSFSTSWHWSIRRHFDDFAPLRKLSYIAVTYLRRINGIFQLVHSNCLWQGEMLPPNNEYTLTYVWLRF